MKILISGFKPFLGEKINPSEQLALKLAKHFDQTTSVILPVEFKTSFLHLAEKIKSEKPECLIMLGQASGRTRIGLEKIALNWMQTEHPDEVGHKPAVGVILASSELALMSKFPIDKVFEEIKLKHQPVEISFSAGTYVCNELYYQVLKNFSDLKSIFIHLPITPEQSQAVEKPTLQFELQKQILIDLIHSLRRN